MADDWRKEAMPSAFSYLLQKEAAVSAEELAMLAKVATKRFVDEKIPLNTTIAKLAEERDLNQHQIERVCELANVGTHQALWPSAKEKHKLAFALADAKTLGKDKTPARRTHTAADHDYAGPPTGVCAGGPSVAELFGVAPGAGHEGLAGPSDKQRLLIILSKKAAERRRLKDGVLVAAMEAESAEKRAYAVVKQEVLGGSGMRDILRAATAAGLGKVAGELLPRFEERLVAEASGAQRTGLTKSAIARAPEELISHDLGATTVVNGAHPVLVSLDTVTKKNGVVQTLLYNLVRIDDEITVARQQLKELG